MKKIIFFIIVLFLISVFVFYNNKSGLSYLEANFELKNITEERKLEKTLNLKGKNILNGSSYQVGDLVFGQGYAIKIEKVGYSKDIYENLIGTYAKSDNIVYAIFNLEFYNFQNTSYKLNLEDVILKYNKKKYETSLDKSGYELWSKLENSFKFSKIEGNTMRKGYLFIPSEQSVSKGGKIIIYMDNIPIEFKY